MSDLAGEILSELTTNTHPVAPADFDPETAQNLEEIEMQFAVKTVEHLEAYQKLILAIKPSLLKLTKIDDALHSDFLSTFPELAPLPNPSLPASSDSTSGAPVTQEEYEASLKPLTVIDEGEMKSAAGKGKWRDYIMKYEKLVPDYNFGTLLRPNARAEYSEDNSMLVTRTQFYAIEIARNRAGINDNLYNQAQAQKSRS